MSDRDEATVNEDVLEDLEAPYFSAVMTAFVTDKAVTFVGAGASECRKEGERWTQGARFLPRGSELAGYLASNNGFGVTGPETTDLARVSQKVAIENGDAALHSMIKGIFDQDYEPSEVHRFVAELPRLVAACGGPRHQLVITTNYDDLLEKAFRKAGEDLDVVSYVADGPLKGKFVHWNEVGAQEIVDPSHYEGLSLSDRSVLLKLHGTVDRRPRGPDPGWLERGAVARPRRPESFLITEQHYIEFLARVDVRDLPRPIPERLGDAQFLFLGYSLRDWNWRVFLYRILLARERQERSWAIEQLRNPLEKYWNQEGVFVRISPLPAFVGELRRRFEARAGDTHAS